MSFQLHLAFTYRSYQVEELHVGGEVLGRRQEPDGNVVGQVIDAVDEGNLAVIAFHCNKLSIHNKEAAESLGIAVGEGDLVVVWKMLKLCNDATVGRIDAFTNAGSQRPNARAFKMEREQWLWLPSVIDGETLPAIIAEVSF